MSLNISNLKYLTLFFFLPLLLRGQTTELFADSLSQAEHYIEANEIYTTLAETSLLAGHFKQYLQFCLKKATNFQALDKHEEALSILRESLEITELPEDTTTALAYHKMGVNAYMLDDFSTAIRYWKKAIEIRKQFLTENHIEIIRAYRNIGSAYEAMNQHELAKNSLLNALDLHLTKSNIDTVLLMRTHRELAYSLTNMRDFGNAEIHLLSALPLYENYYSDEPWEMGEIYEALFFLYYQKDQPQELIKHGEIALKLYEKIIDKYKEDYWMIADIHNNMSLAYEKLGQLDLAFQYIHQSIHINQQYASERQEYLAENWNNLSIIQKRRSNFLLALNALDKAITIDQNLNDKLGLALDFNNQKEIFLLQGELEKALYSQQKALQYLAPEANWNDILAKPELVEIVAGSKTLLITYLAEKAAILHLISKEKEAQAAQYLVAAFEIYQLLPPLLDDIRVHFESDESKQFLLSEAKSIFDEGLAVNFELYQRTKKEMYLENAFTLIEQSKAIVLLDAIQEGQALEQVKLPSTILNRKQKLQQEITDLETELYQNPKAAVTIRQQLLGQRRAWKQLLDTIKQQFPTYYELKYQVQTCDLSQAKTLSKKQTLVQYFLGKAYIYAFIIQPESTNLLQIERPKELKRWIKSLQSGVYTYHLKGLRNESEKFAYADTLFTAAHQLFETLIAPIEQENSLTTKLIVIPDDVLGYIPFELLVRTLPEDNSLFATHHYLIRDYQIRYNYSASLMQKMQERSIKPANDQLLAFAPHFEETASTSSQEIAAVRVRGQLGALKHNRLEAQAICELVGGEILDYEAASKANFLSKASDYQILHLATHGKANDNSGDFAFLAFTATNDSLIDQLLYNRELYNLQLQAEMVVLSACETGIGELQHGEGIISLARGFTYAGAKSIITTLWSVNDAKSKELMLSFYKHLKEGKRKDAALRQAKLDFIDEYHHDAHPFFWAAFIPIGNMEILDFSTNSSYLYWFLPLLLVLITFFLKKNIFNY